jgi:CRISPR/Cas system CMR subunit Cmr6 (Cas7 group RAMP superfamily)
MTVNEIELTLWLAVSTNFTIIFWLLIRSYEKSCQALLKSLKEAIKLAGEAINTCEEWEKKYNAEKQNS